MMKLTTSNQNLESNTPCTECGETLNKCGCDHKVDFICTFYNGDTLETLNIEKGDQGEYILKTLDNVLKGIKEDIKTSEVDDIVIENIGNGNYILKPNSVAKRHQFKSLVESNGIKIESSEEELKFLINDKYLNNLIDVYFKSQFVSTIVNFKWSSVSSKPSNPADDLSQWHDEYVDGDNWMAMKEVINGESSLLWKVIRVRGNDGKDGKDGVDGGQGKDGVASLTSIVFKRSATKPERPRGGSYSSPVPLGWQDGIPVGDGNPAWMSNRLFTSDGNAPQQDLWSDPTVVADSSTIDLEFSDFTGTNPGTPTYPLNGAVWYNEGRDSSVWMASRVKTNGVFGPWSVVKIKGEDGQQGPSGTGFSIVSDNPMESLAVGSDETVGSTVSFLVGIAAYSNATLMTHTTSDTLTDLQYKIEVPTILIQGITVARGNGGSLVFTVAKGTILTNESITIPIKVLVGKNKTAMYTSFSIVPIKTAEDAQSLTLKSDYKIVKFDSWDNLVSPNTINLSAVLQNYDMVVTWSSVPVGKVSGTGFYKSLSTSGLFTEGDSVKIKIMTPNGLFDELDIIKVKDGDEGAPGMNGTSGPVPRTFEWVAGAKYQNGDLYIDYIYYRGTGESDSCRGWYIVKPVSGESPTYRTANTGGCPDSGFEKQAFTSEMSFGTVIAEQANIAGFIFRNQNLESQEKDVMVCDGVASDEIPNLTLAGKSGIIKFLDKLVFTKDGFALRDGCKRDRMVFMFDEVTDTPILKFLDETGKTVWEAGQGGYVYITTGTRESTWESARAVKLPTLSNYTDDSIIEAISSISDRVVISGASKTSATTDTSGKVYTQQVNCGGETSLSTPYSVIITGDLYNGTNALTLHKFIKGDKAEDEPKQAGYYTSQNAVNTADVDTATNIPANGWYVIEGTNTRSTTGLDGSGICTNGRGKYSMLPIMDDNNSHLTTGYWNLRLVYLKKGVLTKTAYLEYVETWNSY